MNRKIELLAPGGDISSIKAAILAGADAVYCGLDKFNARNRATNIRFDDLNGILRLAHKNSCQVFLTLNIIVTDSEIPSLFTLLNKLINTGIDGIIVQDLGLLFLLSNYFKRLKIHASTQLTTHNEGQVLFLNKLNAARVNLSRELNLREIKALTEVAHKNNMLTEVFVHGSQCISFSGLCYMSSVQGGNSGNRGRCSQPCRDQYEATPAGKNFPLNLKDNSAFTDLQEIAEAGVDSLKIEGRIKQFHYVYTVVDAWRKQLENFYNNGEVRLETDELYKVFNRDFSDAYLKGYINKEMFIDNPRDHSAIHLSELNGNPSEEKLEKAKSDIYDERTEIITTVENKIKLLSIKKEPVILHVSGNCGTPLKVSVKMPEASFDICSENNLVNTGTQPLNRKMLESRLKAINDTGYFIEQLNLQNLEKDVYLPFKDITSIKRRILYSLNDSREFIDPVKVPVMEKQQGIKIKPRLSVLISSPADLHLCHDADITYYFQLPCSFAKKNPKLDHLFAKNKNLIPWFPAVIIDEDYRMAVEFLKQLHPKLIVTDNTGIAFEAYKSGIAWIAGPGMNTINSFGLLCLRENFNCFGAFISNEISKSQLKGIKRPNDFKLYYSIYHPIMLMTSRQCLFQTITACRKEGIDDSCIRECEKSETITNFKKEIFYVEKSKGDYHRIYNGINYLNADVIDDFPELFSGFCIDLRNIKTGTNSEFDKAEVIKLFKHLVNGDQGMKDELQKVIFSTTKEQYAKGI